MSWDNLKVVLAISRTGSLTAAARHLGIDQSTAGRRLSAFEAELGVILFTRSKAGFVPTEAGMVTIARANDIEQSYDRMRDTLNQTQHSAVGTVRLVGNPWVLERLSRHALPALLEAHPHLHLHMSTRLPPSPLRGKATIALWFEVPPRAAEFTTALGTIPYGVYHRAGRACDENDWVAFLDDEAPRPLIAGKLRRLMGEHGRLRMTATDAMLLRAAVAGGVGRALLPLCIGDDCAELVRVQPGPAEFSRTLSMHLNPDTIETKRVQTTVDWLRASFAEHFEAP